MLRNGERVYERLPLGATAQPLEVLPDGQGPADDICPTEQATRPQRQHVGRAREASNMRQCHHEF
jgi:hypothetical protein